MLKKIPTTQLQVGMYVHTIDCHWIDHPFFRSSFLVKDDEPLQMLNNSDIHHVVIDTEKGRDCDAEATVDEIQDALAKTCNKVEENRAVLSKQVTVSEEINNARTIYKEATHVIHKLMDDVRLGKQVELEHLEPVTEKIINSVFRNKDALISLTRIKDRDEYTFMHSVSVSALMATFARNQNMPMAVIEDVAMGGLLHDVGKMLVPNEVLSKPEQLSDEEYKIMKLHVNMGYEILSTTTGLSQDALDVVRLHHERIDGSGYPRGLKGDEISEIGLMSNIVDVYDAMTSVRCYKNAWEPSFTLKKLLEWSDSHFSKDLVESFIGCLGIYPVGSLVQLKSGLIGIVMEQGENDLLRPNLRIIYNSRYKKYVQVKDVKLKKLPEDMIVQAVSPARYNIDLAAFI